VRPSRSYRTKLEVLRDFLRAAEEPTPKTRIIGSANLNPLSFQKYLRLCTEHDLIMAVSGGYVATPRASPLLEAIDGVMLKTSELEDAFRLLERNALSARPPGKGGSNPFRQVLREAWNEFTLRTFVPPDAPRTPVLLAAVGGSSLAPASRATSSGSIPEPEVPEVRADRQRARAKGNGYGGRARAPGPGSRSRR
jgi:predicted transcriptional regulator